MKFKHVFLIWFWADVILAIMAIFTVFLFKGGKVNNVDDFWGMLMVIGYGMFVSLPSLIAMMVFHYFYVGKSLLQQNYFRVYTWVIFIINLIYLLLSQFVFTMNGEFLWFFLLSTFAGFLALYLVSKKIERSIRASLIA